MGEERKEAGKEASRGRKGCIVLDTGSSKAPYAISIFSTLSKFSMLYRISTEYNNL
jgi:hypothetical protein